MSCRIALTTVGRCRKSFIELHRLCPLVVRRIASFCSQNSQRSRLFPKLRQFSTKPEESSVNKTAETTTTTTTAKMTMAERFKAAYKQYGKVMLGVHLVLSAGWYGSFYVIASSGFDVAGFFERIGLVNERISNSLRSSAGNAAVAYLLYKLASPIRYGVTLGTTHFAVKYLRYLGYLRTPVTKR